MVFIKCGRFLSSTCWILKYLHTTNQQFTLLTTVNQQQTHMYRRLLYRGWMVMQWIRYTGSILCCRLITAGHHRYRGALSNNSWTNKAIKHFLSSPLQLTYTCLLWWKMMNYWWWWWWQQWRRKQPQQQQNYSSQTTVIIAVVVNSLWPTFYSVYCWRGPVCCWCCLLTSHYCNLNSGWSCYYCCWGLYWPSPGPPLVSQAKIWTRRQGKFKGSVLFSFFLDTKRQKHEVKSLQSQQHFCDFFKNLLCKFW